MAVELKLLNVPIAFVYLDKPDKDGKHRVTPLIDKKNKDLVNQIWDAIDEVIDDGVENIKEWKGKKPKDQDIYFLDGDESADEYPFLEGYMTLTAKNSNPVPMVLQDPEKESKDPYRDFAPGTICNLIVRCYGFKQGGVTFSLEAIQKVEDGERIGGGSAPVNARKAFDKVPVKGGRDRDEDDRGSRGRGRDRDDDDRRSSRDDRDDDRRSSRRDDDRDDRRSSRGDDDRRSSRRDEEDDDRRSSRDDRGSRGRDDEPRKSRDRDNDDDRGRGRDRDDDDRPPRRSRDDDEPEKRGRRNF